LAAQKFPPSKINSTKPLFEDQETSNLRQFIITATMVNKGKLKMALASDKNIDYKKLNLKKREKLARKTKAKKGGDKPDVGKIVEGEWEDVDGSEDEGGEKEIAAAAALDAEDSGSEEEEDDDVEGKMEVWFLPRQLSRTLLTYVAD
jgi:hypothetical protein